MQLQWMSSPNCWPSRFGASPKWLILHATAGFETAQEVAVYFSSMASGVSSHYVVGRDGEVYYCVKESDAAWANGGITGPAGVGGDGVHHDAWWDSSPTWSGKPNPNLTTISIEHVKPSLDNSDQLTPAQQATSFALAKDICSRNGIPMRAADSNGGITGHFSMDPVDRSRCPGPYPWDALWSYLPQGGTMIPQGWSDDGTTLTAPNNRKVVEGFRSFVLANNWPADNWPLEEEHGQSPLELSNPALGSGTQQVFRWSVLEWTPTRGVFVAWCGAELLAWRAKATATPQQS